MPQSLDYLFGPSVSLVDSVTPIRITMFIVGLILLVLATKQSTSERENLVTGLWGFCVLALLYNPDYFTKSILANTYESFNSFADQVTQGYSFFEFIKHTTYVFSEWQLKTFFPLKFLYEVFLNLTEAFYYGLAFFWSVFFAFSVLPRFRKLAVIWAVSFWGLALINLTFDVGSGIAGRIGLNTNSYTVALVCYLLPLIAPLLLSWGLYLLIRAIIQSPLLIKVR